jgi:hypothetical protein
MRHLKTFESHSVNESKGFEILPEDALKELEMYVDYNNPDNKIEVIPDPRVDGTYAVRVYRSDDGYTFDLLWNRGAFDEVEFSSWPPLSGDLKFFESYSDIAEDIAEDLLPKLQKIKDEKGIFTVGMFDNYMEERGGDMKLTDEIMSNLVNMGFDFDTESEDDDEDDLDFELKGKIY